MNVCHSNSGLVRLKIYFGSLPFLKLFNFGGNFSQHLWHLLLILAVFNIIILCNIWKNSALAIRSRIVHAVFAVTKHSKYLAHKSYFSHGF